MLEDKYIYDEGGASFKKDDASVWKKWRRIGRFVLASITMAVIYYLLFSLLFSTATERRLKQENKALAAVIPELEQKERMMAAVIEELNTRDNTIYEDIFKTAAPRLDPMATLDFLGGRGTLTDRSIVSETGRKLDRLMDMSRSIESDFKEIARILDSSGFVVPPMHMPMKNVSFAQVGASVGMKMNPFYKVPVMHEGLDIIASSGDPVYAAAAGVVSDVTRSRKGLGNIVTVKHKGGYYTRYGHLGDIYVDLGMTVRRGQKLGSVGVSNNNSYAPHLHYMVRKDSVALDPVNFFYASIGPEEYSNMLIMSSLTGQSMD